MTEYNAIITSVYTLVGYPDTMVGFVIAYTLAGMMTIAIMEGFLYALYRIATFIGNR